MTESECCFPKYGNDEAGGHAGPDVETGFLVWKQRRQFELFAIEEALVAEL